MRRGVSALVAAAFTFAALAASGITVTLAIASPEVRELGMTGAVWSLPFSAMALIGALLIWRRSTNVTGWVLAAAGLLMVGNAVTHDYTLFAYSTAPPKLGAAASSWLAFWTWVPATQMIGLFFLLFPTGSAISRAWRPVVWGALAIIVASAVAALPTWVSRGPHILEAPTMAAVPGGALLNALSNFGFPLVMLVGLVSLAVRYRRGGAVERHQIKWLLFAAGSMVGAVVLALGVGIIKGTDDPISDPIVGIGTLLAATSVPVAAGIAILRYRLYDIDIVINKTVVFGALAAFITLIYVGVVVGVGSLVGAGGEPNLGLSLAATAVVAVAFQPVRERVQRLANRMVYGQRLSPYEAVTSFSHRMAESLSFSDVLPSVAEAAASAVGGERSKVRLFFPGGGSEEIAWPPSLDSSSNSFDATVSVLHQGEQVGEISVAKKKGEALSPQEHKLLSDLASQAGLAFSNLRLTEELKAKLVELQESRRRIVAAQDEERRRMERDIHDGAQQQLVSMSVKLGLAKSLVARDRDKASLMLEEIRGEATEAIETLRDLARGLFPQVLVDHGVGPEVSSHINKMGLDAEVVDRLDGARFDLLVEANVYFVIREALQNASKHAGGSPIQVVLSKQDGELSFEVRDRGPGFDPAKVKLGSGLQNMADRIEALDGQFALESESGRGTVVKGRMMARRNSEGVG